MLDLVEACAVCGTQKYGGWAGDWCVQCDKDTDYVRIPAEDSYPYSATKRDSWSLSGKTTERPPVTADTDPLVARLNAQLDEIEQRQRDMTGPCKECRFREVHRFSEPDTCSNPLLTGAELDPVTGKVCPKLSVRCASAREQESACGVLGRYFMPTLSPTLESSPKPLAPIDYTIAFTIVRYAIPAVIGILYAIWLFWRT